MSTSSSSLHSQSHVNFSKLAQSEKLLTIYDMNDLNIPKLLNIPKDAFRSSHCNQVASRRLEKFRVNLENIKTYFDELQLMEQDAGHLIKELLRHILDAPEPVDFFTDGVRYRELDNIFTKFFRLIPSTYQRPPPSNVSEKFTADLPNIRPIFESPSTLRQFTESYELLDPLHKSCLLYFSAFPEDAEIKKRTIIHWWVGEELFDPYDEGDDHDEETGHEILATLIEHRLIEHVIKKDRITSRYRVHPFIRTMLIHLARVDNLFDNLEDPRYDGKKHRVCLTKGQNSHSILQHLKAKPGMYIEHIETLFNVNKCYLDIKRRWFCNMKNIKVLYLGRWDTKAIQHIEVKSTKFLSGLKYMKRLRLLSFQGVSKIVKLPDSLGMLKNLRILDLRDCNDIVELPESMKSLEKLAHLDLSGCYALTCLPKGIASLSELHVLKGFLIHESHQYTKDSCDFQDLTKLKKLKKLSIATSIRNFPTKDHLRVLEEMVTLRKLTIAWRVHYKTHFPAEDSTSKQEDKKPFSQQLEKLDLRYFPYRTAPAWLASHKLQKLKKLYIKGGKFLTHFGIPQHDSPWTVETLRLKLLPVLDISFSKLRELFPDLKYLEMVECPQLTTFPCNDEDVWKNIP